MRSTARPENSRSPELREILAPRKRRGSRLLDYAVVVATVVVALLLVLIATGVLRLPTQESTPPAPVIVSYVHWIILQGALPNSTQGWLGPYQLNYTGPEGYPRNVTPGATFTVSLIVSVLGGTGHEVYSVTASSPFQVTACYPALPVMAPPDDDVDFFFTVMAPSEPGAVLGLTMTINALQSTTLACPSP
jgi:hypothetical protein